MIFFRKKHTKTIDLDGTWHTCEHEWQTKMASRDGTTQAQCKKCLVGSEVQNGRPRIILVNPETSHPFTLAPWQQENAKGLVKENHHAE